jgi:peptidoglycan/LPS O-acetylase OafA/YrhL
MFTIARWDALAAGALVAALLRDEAGRQSLARWKPWAAGLAGVALVALVAVNRGFHQDDLPVQVAGQSLILILSASLIAYAVSTGARAPRKLQAFLSLPALRTLGKYSYAMYILHFPLEQSLSPILGEAVRGADTPWRLGRLALYIGVILALTLLAAMLSWRLIERPFLDLKDRIAPRVGGTSSA